MTVGARLPHLHCNLDCRYCFLEPIRTVREHTSDSFSMDIDLIEETGEGINLFGGEPLTLPKDRLRELLRVSYENGQGANINTNGVLVDEDHLEMFEEYDATVGVSVDGPGELNDLRWAGSVEKTRNCTRKTLENVERLSEREIDVDIISVMSQCNAGTAERLEQFKDFVLWLSDLGIKTGDLIYLRRMTSSGDYGEFMLAPHALGEVWVSIAKFFERHPDLLRSPLTYYKRLIVGKSNRVPCYWRACDIKDDDFNLRTVERGEIVKKGCLVRGHRGFEPLATERSYYGRYVDLFETPGELGGCSGCRFYSICLGHCPNDGEKRDSRNRSMYCETQQIIFAFYEKLLEEKGIQPFTLHPAREDVEEVMLEGFRSGEVLSAQDAIEKVCPAYLE